MTDHSFESILEGKLNHFGLKTIVLFTNKIRLASTKKQLTNIKQYSIFKISKKYY